MLLTLNTAGLKNKAKKQLVRLQAFYFGARRKTYIVYSVIYYLHIIYMSLHPVVS